MTAVARYFCPLDCGWHHDQAALDFTDRDRLYPIADLPCPEGVDLIAFGAAAGELQAVDAIVKAHLETHELIEWVQAVGRLKTERDRLTAELERRLILACGASMATGIGDPVGPCTLRYNHDGPVHQDATGCRWWGTTTFAANTAKAQQ
ncbi:hypothetical protein [Kitasatospora sp. NBC_01302]|uniref:hypothetical protein n=1 Tax=Kitasatospora sp. NBC_01302 TaxID=2903575 RepID=UPI002E15C3A2|nr:hypothetical protein OG294_13925 [Kitasatospora sp. NBC_01302]